MKNNLHLAGILGLVLIGFGIIFCLLSGMGIYNFFKYQQPTYATFSYTLINIGADFFFFLLATAYLLVGGGLLGKASWSINSARVLCIFSFFGWLYVLLEIFQLRIQQGADFWVLVGISFASFGFLVVELFFLFQLKVVEDFKKSATENWDDEILDA